MKYEKTVWQEGDIISEDGLNNIEVGIKTLEDEIEDIKMNAVTILLSTDLPENVVVNTGNDLEVPIFFKSLNVGSGTLKVVLNDDEILEQSVPQGESSFKIESNKFVEGINRLRMYVIDTAGTYTNMVNIVVTYGGLKITTDFNTEKQYELGSTIRMYYTPTSTVAGKQLNFHIKIGSREEEVLPCISGTRNTYTFDKSLGSGSHKVTAWVSDDTGMTSNVLSFNLIIIDGETLVIASSVSTVTKEEGYTVSLDYRVGMSGHTKFNTQFYIGDELYKEGTCGINKNYWNISTLGVGRHVLRMVASTLDGQHTAEYDWLVKITESTIPTITYTGAGCQGAWTARDRSNTETTKNVWLGKNDDGETVGSTMYNYAYTSTNGWNNDTLLSTGDAYTELDIAPLKDNCPNGFTLDIEFFSQFIGNDDATVLKLWDDEYDCGIKISAHTILLKSKSGNKIELDYTDNEVTSAIIRIDRNDKIASIALNGVISEAFLLSDYTTEQGISVLEDFTVKSNIIIGNKDSTGWSGVKNLRIYDMALTADELMNNYLSNIIDKAQQREKYLFQKGDSIPTLVIKGDFYGITKDEKRPCTISYQPVDQGLYGTPLENVNGTIHWQGTSSLSYPVKNYRINLLNDDGTKMKWTPFNDGKPESRFCLKADYMESSHSHNTGVAKLVNDYLYEGVSKNPARQTDLSVRDTINGFPCRLILTNTGNTPMEVGKTEPNPNETKDMGIFNLNHDKNCTSSLGLDINKFPQCKSYEVTANSDVSAGAFVSFASAKKGSELLIYEKSINNNNGYSTTSGNWCSNYIPVEEGTVVTFKPTNISTNSIELLLYRGIDNIRQGLIVKNGTVTIPSGIKYVRVNCYASEPVPEKIDINGKEYKTRITSNESEIHSVCREFQGEGTREEELAYLQDSFELRYPKADDVGEDYGFVDTNGDDEYSLKRVIDKVDAWDITTDEGIAEMRSEFSDYFDEGYTLRYLCCTLLLGMIDNMGKNMMLDTWDGKIWYPRFYDLDSCLSLDNSGYISIPVDAEMVEGYYNTSNSNLWTKVQVAFEKELKEQYRQMRLNGFNYENILNILYGQQISKIPESYYNKDAQVKYLENTGELSKMHGRRYEQMKKWLKERLLYIDTLMDYASSTSENMQIRANTLTTMNLDISTYSPMYLKVSWRNGVVQKLKVDGKTPTRFSGKANTATDQEVIIYGASNIKTIDGITSCNPSTIRMSNCTKLTKLDIQDAPILEDIDTGANLSNLTFLSDVNLKGCTALKGQLNMNKANIIKHINIQGTAINDVSLPAGCVSLKEIWYPKTISTIILSDLPKLHTLGLEYGHSCKELRLTNCPSVKAFGNKEWNANTMKYKYPDGYFLGGVRNLYLDNSYDVEEICILGSEQIESVTLKNLKNTRELTLSERLAVEKFVTDNKSQHNNTYYPSLEQTQGFGDFKLNTDNCPNLKTFSTKTNRYRYDWFSDYSMGNINLIKEKAIEGTSQMSDSRFYQTGFHCNRCDLSNSSIENVNLFITSYIAELVLPETTSKLRVNPLVKFCKDDQLDYLSGDLNTSYNPSGWDWDGQGFAQSIIYSIATSTDDLELRKWKLGDLPLTDFEYPLTKQSRMVGDNFTYSDFTIDEVIVNLTPENYTPRFNSDVFGSVKGRIDLSNFRGYSLKDALSGLTDEVDYVLPINYDDVLYFNGCLKAINTTKIKWNDELPVRYLNSVLSVEDTKYITLAEQDDYDTEGIIINSSITSLAMNGANNTSMFYKSNLKYIKEFNTNCNNISWLFGTNGTFEHIPVERIGIINAPNCTYATHVFRSNATIKQIDEIRLAETCDTQYILERASNLAGAIKVVCNSTNSVCMFSGTKLSSIDLSEFTVNGSTDSMFSSVPLNNTIELTGTSTDCYNMFNNAKIPSADLSNLRITNARLSNMFYNARVEGTVKLVGTAGSACGSMFNSANIGNVDLSEMVFESENTTVSSAFQNAIIGNLIPPTNLSGVTSCNHMFYNATIKNGSLPDMSKSTSCTTMNQMYYGYKGSVLIPTPFILPSGANNLANIFDNCKAMPTDFEFDCRQMEYVLHNKNIFTNSAGMTNLIYRLPKNIYNGSMGTTGWNSSNGFLLGSSNIKSVELDWSAYQGNDTGFGNFYSDITDFTFKGIAWDKFGNVNINQSGTQSIKDFTVHEPASNTNINIGSWRMPKDLHLRFVDEGLATLDCANLIPANKITTEYNPNGKGKIIALIRYPYGSERFTITTKKDLLSYNIGSMAFCLYDDENLTTRGYMMGTVNFTNNSNGTKSYTFPDAHYLNSYPYIRLELIMSDTAENLGITQDDWNNIAEQIKTEILNDNIVLSKTNSTQTSKTLTISRYTNKNNSATLSEDDKAEIISKATTKGWNVVIS